MHLRHIFPWKSTRSLIFPRYIEHGIDTRPLNFSLTGQDAVPFPQKVAYWLNLSRRASNWAHPIAEVKSAATRCHALGLDFMTLSSILLPA
jgi:hypothetical protein